MMAVAARRNSQPQRDLCNKAAQRRVPAALERIARFPHGGYILERAVILGPVNPCLFLLSGIVSSRLP